MTAVKRNPKLGKNSMSNSKASEYDGFYFLPGEDDNEYNISFFTFNEGKGGTPIENTEVGFKYHVAFFKWNEDESVEFNDTFEAIFADPLTYIEGLVGSRLYGTFVRKTEKSKEWFDNYLSKTLDSVTIQKSEEVIEMAKSIANN
jgi:hypothetical protein